MIITGVKKLFESTYQSVIFPNFPYELLLNENGKLCRFLHCLGIDIKITDGEGTIVTNKDGFVGHVLKDGYKESGEIITDNGSIFLKEPSFINTIKLWENFVFHRYYNESNDPYIIKSH